MREDLWHPFGLLLIGQHIVEDMPQGVLKLLQRDLAPLAPEEVVVLGERGRSAQRLLELREAQMSPALALLPLVFEPVPRQGSYEVMLLDASGAPMSTPSELISVYAEPTRKPVGLETGERLR